VVSPILPALFSLPPSFSFHLSFALILPQLSSWFCPFCPLLPLCMEMDPFKPFCLDVFVYLLL
jgi:hypothetical protein